VDKLFSFLSLDKNKNTDGNTAVDRGEPIADIALLLEGTYPYIRGGVSSWVHQIITGLPEYTFSLIFLGGESSSYGSQKYELPDNVVHLEHHYLMDLTEEFKPKRRKGNPKAFADIRGLHEQFKTGKPIADKTLTSVFNNIGREGGISKQDFLFSEQSWKVISDSYEKYCTEPSFIDYFWSVRIMHAPLFMLAEAARNMPHVRSVHSISTGYAGLLGVMIAQQRDIPYILTEHGIYTKERKIDLAQASWIYDPVADLGGALDDEVGYIRQLWIRFFELSGRLTYQKSNPIISLYEGNRQRQIDDGAEKEKTLVIPNGIELEKFREVREARGVEVPMVLGLIGRVVPIKDIKTFIRAMRAVCDELPEAEGWIAGPEDEDEEYVQECKDLVRGLGLENRVKFLGFQDIFQLLPQLGLMVLTSISEALPLVILEAYAAGLPCLATDVGSCRELIEGGSEEDKKLGKSGEVVPIADPDAVARAAVSLLTDTTRWYESQKIGLERAQRFYTHKMMFDKYRTIYSEALASFESSTVDQGNS